MCAACGKSVRMISNRLQEKAYKQKASMWVCTTTCYRIPWSRMRSARIDESKRKFITCWRVAAERCIRLTLQRSFLCLQLGHVYPETQTYAYILQIYARETLQAKNQNQNANMSLHVIVSVCILIYIRRKLCKK